MDELVRYRLESAFERLESAELLLQADKYRDSISRSYYAIFSAIRAILAKDRIDFSKHSAVIAFFQKEYIKTGRIDRKYSKYVQNAFQIRNNCDYNDFFLVSRDTAKEQYLKAAEFCNMVKSFLAIQE